MILSVEIGKELTKPLSRQSKPSEEAVYKWLEKKAKVSDKIGLQDVIQLQKKIADFFKDVDMDDLEDEI